MNQGQGNIGFNTAQEQPLVSTGGGLPIFVPPNKIKSLTEETGIRLDDLGPGTSIGIANRLNYFFVTQFGAKGDGVTDDTAAIQACATAAGASGFGNNVIFFPAGQYLISATIVFPATSLYILGAGPESSVTQIITHLDGLTAFSIPGRSTGVANITFVCTLLQTAGAAINCTERNLTVRECGFIGFFNGIVQTQQLGSRISGCGFTDIRNHCIDISNSISANTGGGNIFDCVFTCSSVNTAAGIFLMGSGFQRISGCRWIASPTTFVNGIQLSIPGAAFNTSVLVIANCNIEQFTGSGIRIDVVGGGGFFDIDVVGCEISSFFAGNGITAVGTGGSLSFLTIAGCVIGNNANGISLTDLANVMLSGNVFRVNVTDVVRAGVTTAINTGLAADNNGAAPATTPLVVPGIKYGSGAAVLTTPDAWAAVVIYTAAGPTTYKMPLYL